MTHWRLTAKRVTKYNPSFRDEQGNYMIHEWSSFNNVGSLFNGVVLELRSYIEVEQRYIKAIMMFCNELNCDIFQVQELEKYHTKGMTAQEIFFYDELTEDAEIGLERIEELARFVLRENIWCELVCKNDHDNSIHFGYDYYMYFSSNILSKDFFNKIEQIGLFVD
jgi:hypothetical protein